MRTGKAIQAGRGGQWLLRTVSGGMLFAGCCAAGVLSYDVQIIPPPTGITNPIYLTLNSSGQAAGYGNMASGSGTQAIIGMTSGSVAVPIPLKFLTSSALGINDAAEVSGVAFNSTGREPFAGTASGSAALPSPPGEAFCSAQSINNSGQAGLDCGEAVYIGTASGTTPIPFAAGASAMTLQGINDTGEVTGTAVFPGGMQQAYIGTTSGVTLVPLPAGIIRTQGFAINASGEVAGLAFDAGGHQAVFIGNTTSSMVLPEPPGASFATADQGSINSAGTVVGGSTMGGWIWDAADGTQLLNGFVPAGWNISRAFSINDSGQILALGTEGGISNWVLLTPQESTPEPASYLFVGAALLLGISAPVRRGSSGRSNRS